MILTEFWKARTLHRTCTTKPLTTAMLKGARPHYIIHPRANNTASGDTLVVLHVRKRPCSSRNALNNPDLPPLPGITHTWKTPQQQQQHAREEDANHNAGVAATAQAAIAATGDGAMRERIAAALTPLLSGVPGRGGGLDWRALEAGVDDVWPPG